MKPLPAIFLPNRADFPETVDGLVFGVAAGLGFSLAESADRLLERADQPAGARRAGQLDLRPHHARGASSRCCREAPRA